MPGSPALSVVLPVLNEEDSLERLHEELESTLGELGRPAEILYVDDASTDRSPEILAALAGRASGGPVRTRVVTLRRNYGQTAALSAGIDLAEGEIIVPMDADGQNDPSDIPRLVTAMGEEFDVVSGWRRSRKDRFSRVFPSIVANRLISSVSGLPLHDYGCTLKAYRASLLKQVRLYGDTHRFIPVFMANLGARVTEVEVSHRPRFGGQTKYGSERILKVAADLVHIRFLTGFYTRPMHFFGPLAAGFLALVGVVTTLMFAFKFGWLRLIGIDYQASFISTPLPSLAATFFLGGVLALFFGLVCEILIRIHHEAGGFGSYGILRITDSRDHSD